VGGAGGRGVGGVYAGIGQTLRPKVWRYGRGQSLCAGIGQGATPFSHVVRPWRLYGAQHNGKPLRPKVAQHNGEPLRPKAAQSHNIASKRYRACARSMGKQTLRTKVWRYVECAATCDMRLCGVCSYV